MIGAVSLYAGVGGLDEGARRAGATTVAAFELNRYAAEAFCLNHRTATYVRDCRTASFRAYRGIADALIAGPPCQPFSIAGRGDGEDDERAGFSTVSRAVREIEPSVVLVENVPNVLSSKHRAAWDTLAARLGDDGYLCRTVTLDAADFGVPQSRRRVFLLASRYRLPDAPEPTHSLYATGNGVVHPWRTVRDALLDDADPVPTANECYNPSRVVYARRPIVRRGRGGMLVNGRGRPLPLDGVAPTLPASCFGNHAPIVDFDGVLAAYGRELVETIETYGEDNPRVRRLIRSGDVERVRRVTLNECKRLMGFADGYRTVGPSSAQFSQIGNAVCPPVAEACVRTLLATLS